MMKPPTEAASRITFKGTEETPAGWVCRLGSSVTGPLVGKA
jgi:hypothetical protein